MLLIFVIQILPHSCNYLWPLTPARYWYQIHCACAANKCCKYSCTCTWEGIYSICINKCQVFFLCDLCFLCFLCFRELWPLDSLSLQWKDTIILVPSPRVWLCKTTLFLTVISCSLTASNKWLEDLSIKSSKSFLSAWEWGYATRIPQVSLTSRSQLYFYWFSAG